VKTAERTAALLALVEAHREARCRELLAPAAEEARRIAAAARRAARQRVGAAITAERAANAASIASAEARLATRSRMARQHRLKALIAEGWQRLPPALERRWAEKPSRQRWVQAGLERALATLPRGAWTVECPASWSGAERADAREWLAARSITATIAAAPDIAAGLRIAHGGILLDATVAGLAADRLAIEGRLLHHYGGDAP
jgi:hypothetical protein